jgi:type I restriction enzyme, S subunit
MSEWGEKTLGEVIDKFIDYRGKTPKKSQYGIPLVTAKIVKNGRILKPNEFINEKDYKNWMQRGYPEIDDVVLTTEAPVGEVALIKNKDIALAQRIITLRSNPRILFSKFLKYYLQSDVGQYKLESRASGTTVFGIKSSILKEVPIPLPTLPEQKAIASVLSSLDDKIDLLHRQNKTLESMAVVIFRKWFIEDADDSWEEGKLGDIIKPQKGKNITKLQTIHGQYPVIAGGLSPSCYHNQCNTKSPVVTISASGANAGFVNLHFLPVWSSDSSFIDNSITDYVFFFYILLKSYQEEIYDQQEGSAQPHIYPSHLMDLDIFKYNLTLIENYEAKVLHIFNKISSNQKQIKTLESLLNTLLPKLMSGSIRVKYEAS